MRRRCCRPGWRYTEIGDLDELIQRIRAASGRLTGLRGRVEAGAPWPLSDRFGTEPEASWGPPEALSHVAEMLPFWQGEIERILAGPSEPVPFGRVATDELRLGVIERDRSLPPRELFDRIGAGADRISRRLGGLSGAEAARRGLHPRLGELSVSEVADRFVASHLEEHADQLAEILAAGTG